MITGASSGIGLGVARAFAAAGHPLLLISRHVIIMFCYRQPAHICIRDLVVTPTRTTF